MVSIYIAPEVEQVLALHPYLTDPGFKTLPIAQQIELQAGTLLSAHEAGDRRIGMQVQSWWPSASGKSLENIMAGEFSQSDAVLTICREYGFADWKSVQALRNLTLEPGFEQALDTVLAGGIDQLESMLEDNSDLAVARTRYGHQSTLLHYLGANGVETHRQRTPLNAAEMAKLLIRMGASKKAEANMYGGGQTPLALASTSAHPYKAGISEELNLILQPD